MPFRMKVDLQEKTDSGKSTDVRWNNVLKYGISGFLIGLIFPLAGTLLALRNNLHEISFSYVWNLHIHQPLLQIIDLAPGMLCACGLYVGYKTEQSIRIIKDRKNEKYRTLIEEAIEVIFIADYKGNFRYFNESIRRVYGYNPAELIGAHFTSLIHPSMKEKVAAFYLNQFKNKIPETICDFQILDFYGEPRWVEQTVILRSQNGRVDGFHCVVRNIDERVKQEKEIQNLNVQLGSKLEELNLANQELEAFNHTVSHDLRSPLRGISTLAEIMQMEFGDNLPQEAHGLLSRIIVNTNKIQQLVEDLLEFSKVGKAEIKKETVNMTTLIDQLLTEALTKDPDNKTSVQVDKLADSYCDKKLITQVWVNFISNAIKYSAKKEVPLIRIGNFFRNNEQVYFIKDNGAGFDMTYYKKLFNAFSRLHTDMEFLGTGVGLSIVKRIVERHGGKVWAEGETGIGATFYFSLPVNLMDQKKESEEKLQPVFYS